ncbi:MAG: hypothetical protein KDJ65_11840 [Anaerolineae bacterium]|nr:hypothetical protein [Anaerolineae bacterium]
MNESWGVLAFFIISLGFPIVWDRLERKQPNTTDALYPFDGLVEFFYFVGIPYITLLLGLLTWEHLGLTGLSSFNLIDWNSNIILELQQATTLLLLSWLFDSGIALLAGGTALLLLVAVRWGLARQAVRLTPLNSSWINVIYDACHWAFYRAIFWGITGDLYLGTVLGITAVLSEWIVVAKLRNQALFPSHLLINAIILVLTATTFFYSPNLWLLLPFHGAMVSMMSRRRASEAQHVVLS